MESLFGYSTVDKNKTGRRKEPLSLETPQYIQIIDTKKAQNLSILLRALNVTTEEVCDALQEGNLYIWMGIHVCVASVHFSHAFLRHCIK